MDDILVDKSSGNAIYAGSVFNTESEGLDLVQTEDWQRLIPQYRYRLNIREEKSEDIFYGGQMCE